MDPNQNPYDFRRQLDDIAQLINPSVEDLMYYLQSQEAPILIAAVSKIPRVPIDAQYRDGITSLYMHSDIGVRCSVIDILPHIFDFTTASQMIKKVLIEEKSSDIILTALSAAQRLFESNELTIEVFLEFVEIILSFINHKEWRIRSSIQLLIVDIVSFLSGNIVEAIDKKESNDYVDIVMKVFKRGIEDSCLEVRKQAIDSIADLVAIFNDSNFPSNTRDKHVGDDFADIFVFPLICQYSTHPNYKIRQSIITAMVVIGSTMQNETLVDVFLPMILNYAFDLTTNVRLTLIKQLDDLVHKHKPIKLKPEITESRIIPCVNFLLKDSDSDVVEACNTFMTHHQMEEM